MRKYLAEPVGGKIVKFKVAGGFMEAARVFFKDSPATQGVTISGGLAGIAQHFTRQPAGEILRAPMPVSEKKQQVLRRALKDAESELEAAGVEWDLACERGNEDYKVAKDAWRTAVKKKDDAFSRLRRGCGLPYDEKTLLNATGSRSVTGEQSVTEHGPSM